MLKKIYVDNISCNPSISVGQDLQVTVSGNLPSPAYTFEKFEVEVKGQVIEITPLAKYDANQIVTQIIIPFKQVCTVPDLKSGTYDIKVNTRIEAIVKKELVRVTE